MSPGIPVHPRKDLFPGYDVMAKRDSPSWNAKTRAVIDERLAITPETHRFLDATEFAILQAVADRIVPQPVDRTEPVPTAAMVDHKLASGEHDGYRYAGLPEQGEAWRRGLKALDAQARDTFGAPFCGLGDWARDELLKACATGELKGSAWGGMPSDLFFKKRVIPDLVKAYYAHPTAWNEIGWGGPASPRGYVRMGFDRRDPWEAAESTPGREDKARAENLRVGR